ncbi:hypothetical protein OS493_002278 [Desmophyllum pertusum]|uniref:Uncharacterized protein n=1 Tax=Desmophyllum pertusum TaxID=174260 RepID=A0A9W9Z8K3_9CNID|nr:hypothetical protein OS493_002278 [Desmophyllum pertusum]
MENQTIVLILALFMGVTLAYDSQEPPGTDGLIRKRSMPRKWSLFEPSFERSRKTSDELQRRKLPYKATTGIDVITSEDEYDEYEAVCKEKQVPANLENVIIGRRVFTPTTKYEYTCKEQHELPEDLQEGGEIIENKWHQICIGEHAYCFTKTRSITVIYSGRSGRSPPFVIRRRKELRMGCECRYAQVKKR